MNERVPRRGASNWWLLGALGLLLGAALTGLLVARAARQGTPPVGPSEGGTDPTAETALFRDVTAESGISFTYHNGEEANHYAILESLGGGVALLDYDGDGLLDIFLTGGGFFDGPDKKTIQGHPCKLYKNLGGFKFRDVTPEVGLDRLADGTPWFYNHGCAVADYDNDGWPDLLVTGYGRLALFHNEAIDPHHPERGRKFVEVTQRAGLTDTLWSTSAAFADFDGDGYPDLYVCHYVNWSFSNHPECPGYSGDIRRDICPPKQFQALPHRLYRNNRDGTFADVSREAGLRADGKGLGVLVVDVNDDRKPDIYVANDTTDNFLYLNRSQPGQVRFEEVGMSSGVAVSETGVADGSMGVAAADYNGSGRPSLWVTNYENEMHALYRNVGNNFFLFSTQVSGIAAIGRIYVGFGTSFLDVDRDGREDIVVTNGHVIRHSSRLRQKPVLLHNEGGGHFQDFTAQGGAYFREGHIGRGLVVGDLNNDGRANVIINHLNAPVVLLRHEPPAEHHWLGVELVGRDHRDLVGAKLVLEANGQRQTRFAQGGGSYLSSGDRRHLFGLAKATKIDRLTVTWPSGQTQQWDGSQLATDRYHRLVEGN